MKRLHCFLLVCAVLLITNMVRGQDKIYLSNGKVRFGKVKSITLTHVKYIRNFDSISRRELHRVDTAYKNYNTGKKWIDSIVYGNGTVDRFTSAPKAKLTENIPQLNTWNIDPMGLVNYSISQAYERRIVKGLIGLRIHLYFAYKGGGIAGVGIFEPQSGVFFPQRYYDQQGSKGKAWSGLSLATGINPKFYFIKNRRVRPFGGPELDIGYAHIVYYRYVGSDTYKAEHYSYGSYAALAKFGLVINPVDKMNITIDGGGGVGNLIGPVNPLGLVGVWHFGIAFGINF